MKTVVIESPYAGDTDEEVEVNLTYLRRCMAYCLAHDAAPFASHGLYTQPGVLDDRDPVQRQLGIKAGFVWGEQAQERWFFVDLGVTSGMIEGWKEAKRLQQMRQIFTLEMDESTWIMGSEALLCCRRWTP